MVKKITKMLLILALASPVLLFLNTGNSFDPMWKTFQTIGFSATFSTSLIWPVLRKYFLILSAVLLIMMSAVFIFDQTGWAEIFGSSGFGLILLLLLSYIPQFAKLGYIERI